MADDFSHTGEETKKDTNPQLKISSCEVIFSILASTAIYIPLDIHHTGSYIILNLRSKSIDIKGRGDER